LRGYTKGIELTPEWRITGRWRLRGSYSFLHMNIGPAPNSGDIGTAPGIVGSSPQHQAWVQSSYDFSKRLEMDLTYRYVSALVASSQMIPAYSTGDVHFAWRFRPGWEWSVVGQNLLQPWHPEYAGDPGPVVGIVRNAYMKLTWMR
jgi:iron complex outermembrane receptor protein